MKYQKYLFPNKLKNNFNKMVKPLNPKCSKTVIHPVVYNTLYGFNCIHHVKIYEIAVTKFKTSYFMWFIVTAIHKLKRLKYE